MRCQCTGCASGQHGAYLQLLHAAQQDQDGAHRQQAMDVISLAMPYSHAGADAFAAPALQRLYPAEPPPSTMAEVTERARKMAASIVTAARASR